MPGYRYNPDREWGVVGANWYEDPDALHAQNDYGAAMRDLPEDADRPPFSYDDWRTADAQPTHPPWSCQGCDEHPERYPQAEPEPDSFPGEPPGRIWEPEPDSYEPQHLRPGRWWNR